MTRKTVLHALLLFVAAVIAAALLIPGRLAGNARSDGIAVLVNHASIASISLRGGAVVNLSAAANFPADAEHPSYAPNGKLLAFAGAACQSCDPAIYIWHVGSTRLQRLTSGFDPSWSSRGALAITRRINGSDSVFLVDPAGGVPRRLLPPGRVTPEEDANESSQAAWAPDGTKLAFAREVNEKMALFVSTADGKRVQAIANTLNSRQNPNWSPDGNWIVFSEHELDSRNAIAVMHPDGSAKHILEVSASSDLEPVWSPDGRWIAFASDRGNTPGFHSIYVMAADGGHLRRLTLFAGDDSSPTWSPDSKTIVFVRRPSREIPQP